jgi:hypothetical protein
MERKGEARFCWMLHIVFHVLLMFHVFHVWIWMCFSISLQAQKGADFQDHQAFRHQEVARDVQKSGARLRGNAAINDSSWSSWDSSWLMTVDESLMDWVDFEHEIARFAETEVFGESCVIGLTETGKAGLKKRSSCCWKSCAPRWFPGAKTPRLVAWDWVPHLA